MKTRAGFISNSSSSSFIVMASANCSTVVSINIDVDLANQAEYIICTKEELDKYLKDMYYERDDLPNWYDKAVKGLAQGQVLYIGSFSNENCDDSGVETYLCNHGIVNTEHDPRMVIIEGDGGF